MNAKNDPQPMDPSVPVSKTGVETMPAKRSAYSLEVLIAEFTGAFPETNFETGSEDGRGVSHSVLFDLSMLASADLALFRDLVKATEVDDRIEYVIVDNDQAEIGLWQNPRLRDSREPFGVDEAILALAEGGSL